MDSVTRYKRMRNGGSVNYWFKFHHGIISNMKLMSIARASGNPMGLVVATWTAIMVSASEAKDRGRVDDFDPEIVDAMFGMPEGTAQNILGLATEKGLITNGYISDWDEVQGTATPARSKNAIRQQAYRDRKKAAADTPCQDTQCGGNESVTRNVTEDVTSNVTECTYREEKNRIEENREEKKDTPPTPSRRGRKPAPANDPEFDEFWAVYPRREARPAAIKAFAAAKVSKENPWPGITAVIKAVTSQTKAKGWDTDNHYCPMPSTWLNNARWTDVVSTSKSVTPKPGSNTYYRDLFAKMAPQYGIDPNQNPYDYMDSVDYTDTEAVEEEPYAAIEQQ